MFFSQLRALELAVFSNAPSVAGSSVFWISGKQASLKHPCLHLRIPSARYPSELAISLSSTSLCYSLYFIASVLHIDLLISWITHLLAVVTSQRCSCAPSASKVCTLQMVHSSSWYHCERDFMFISSSQSSSLSQPNFLLEAGGWLFCSLN